MHDTVTECPHSFNSSGARERRRKGEREREKVYVLSSDVMLSLVRFRVKALNVLGR